MQFLFSNSLYAWVSDRAANVTDCRSVFWGFDSLLTHPNNQ